MDGITLKKYKSFGPESADRRADRAEDFRESYAASEAKFFGYSVIQAYGQPKKVHPDSTIADDELKSLIATRPHVFFSNFLEYLKQVDDIATISRAFGFGNRRNVTPGEIIEMVQTLYLDDTQESIFPEHVALSFIHYRFKMVQEREIELTPKFERVQAMIRQRLDAAIARGELRLDPTTMDERLKLIRIMVCDELLVRFDGIGGRCDTATSHIFIPSNISDQEIERVLAHETFHILSGSHEVTEQYFDEFSGPSSEYFFLTRSGLAFDCLKGRGRDDVKKRRLNLGWFNEAVTEMLTIDLLSLEDSTSYQVFRNFVEALIGAGLPKKVIYDAYFENYNPESEGHQVSAVATLFDEVHTRFGKRFLVNLERYVFSLAEREFGDREEFALEHVLGRLTVHVIADPESFFKKIKEEGVAHNEYQKNLRNYAELDSDYE